MTDISKFLKVDSKAQNEGTVVQAGDFNKLFDGSWVRMRSTRSTHFNNRLDKLTGELATKKRQNKSLRRSERNEITVSEQADLRIQAIVDVCILEVGGWTWGAEPVDTARFKELLVDPDCAPLAGLVITMGNSIGIADDETDEEDAGNLPAPSNGGGATSETTTS